MLSDLPVDMDTPAPRSNEGLTASLTRAILAGSSDAIVAADRNGVIQLWNPGAERIFGYPVDQALGATLDLIIPERLREAHWRGYEEVMRTGRSRYSAADVLTVPGIRRGGGRVSLEFTIALLEDREGRRIGIAAVLRDVTARFDEVKALRRQLADLSRGGSSTG